MKDLSFFRGKSRFLRVKKMMTITNKNHKLLVPYNLVSTMRAGVLTM